MVTVISAVIIFLVATAGVRGFALMLLIGTALSLVTAVFATRAILGLLARFRWFDNPKFMGATSEQIPAWQRVDIVGRRRIWFAISGVLIGLSILSLLINGLNLGIDFKGGSAVDFTTSQPVALESRAVGDGGDRPRRRPAAGPGRAGVGRPLPRVPDQDRVAERRSAGTALADAAAAI